MTIDKLSEKRKKLRQQLIDNDAMDGFKELLTVLYSDKVHFIYELLQNAEDVGASQVQFTLSADGLEFEHNGNQLFDIEDVKSITNIGSSTKTKIDDVTSIGKFGIGFKSVFAYTATPEIESGDFHFRIHDMFVPDTEGLAPGSLGEKKTRFVFPFDNPEKPPEEARHEIEMKLRQLNEDALLFLNNICKIEYRLPDLTSGFLKRKQSADDENRIEILVKRPEHSKPQPTYYLRFTKDVNVQDDGKRKECRIAVAFDIEKQKNKNWKIIALNPGQVYIYFPAVDETSNLRFHLHAPFASTVARNIVRKDCPANDELRNHITDLIGESMHAVRDRELLNVEFLATLPNDKDNLSLFYLPIREQLIEEFNQKKLVPMKQGGHAAASECYRGTRALSNLIKNEDLAVLLGKQLSQLLWIANPQQNNQREDNFLSLLDISQWTIEDLIKVLGIQSDRVTEWLAGKPDGWHQNLYVLLDDFLSRASSSPYYIARERKEKLSNLCIVRCSDGEYKTGNECHFPISDVEYNHQEAEAQEEEFYYVAEGVYTSGDNEYQQEKARAFLEKIGVCEVDETERIKVILKQRYTKEAVDRLEDKQHIEDMKRFITFVEKELDNVDVFNGKPIFKTSKGYLPASDVFLDAPYLDTGLEVCYGDEDADLPNTYYSLVYEKSCINVKRLGEFAKTVGALTKLDVTLDENMHNFKNHPEWDHLGKGSGNFTEHGIDEDYYIIPFYVLIYESSNKELKEKKSKLVWETMCSLPEQYLKARFRWHAHDDIREANSSFVHQLRNAEWVPQKTGKSKTFFVRPCDALIKQLPKGFPYETGQKWLEAIEFGKTAEEKSSENKLKRAKKREQNQNAKEFGFGSADEAKKAAEFFEKTGVSVEESLKKLQIQDRRKELLIIELKDAEEKNYEILARSVKTTGNTIDPRTSLREMYTTGDSKMECQMCRQDMPFKKRNSDEDYFEAVEALGKGYFFKEHEAQYLALCPECAAKYKELVKKDEKARDDFFSRLKNLDDPQIRLESNGESIRIWFEDKHWQDLKTVLYYYENVYNPDDSD